MGKFDINTPKILTKIAPHKIYGNELLAASGIGAGAGLALSVYLDKDKRLTRKDRIKRLAKRMLYGALIGAATDVGVQKIKEQLGGRYVGRRQDLPDLNKTDEVEVYITGADSSPMRYWKKREKHKNTAFFAWDEKEDAIDYIKSLPKHVKTTLIGHSFGGDTAYDVANEPGIRLHRLQLLDPIGARGRLSTIIGKDIPRPKGMIDTYAIEQPKYPIEHPEHLTEAQRLSNLYAYIGGRYDKDHLKDVDKLTIFEDNSHALEDTKWRRS